MSAPTGGQPSNLPAFTGNCSDISSFGNDNRTPILLGGSPVGQGIPAYPGRGPTQGVLVYNGQEARLVSGQGHPGSWLAQIGLKGQTITHVEGHAVSIMRQCSISQATLYLNQKPCRVGPAWCQQVLPRWFPQGWILEVVYERDDHQTTGTGRFKSSGWEEP
jgi:hypothetical protein